MSFADNLVYIRQYHGVTQEAIAEQLGVSRQTISKWEAGINYPETDKLLMLCDLYHTNLDDLMRGSVKMANAHDTELYNKHMNRFSGGMTALVVLAILGVACSILLQSSGFPDNISSAVLMLFVLVAVVIGIASGMNHADFKRKNSQIDPIYPDEVLDRFSRRFIIGIVSVVGLILLDLVMLLALMPDEENAAGSMSLNVSENIVTVIFMVILAIAVGILVFSGMQKMKYDCSEISYIAEDGSVVRSRTAKTGWTTKKAKTPQELRRDHITGSLCAIIMIAATIAFFIMGFSGGTTFSEGGWKQSGFSYAWIAFAVGGLLCGIVSIAVGAFMKTTDEIVDEARKEDPWIKIDQRLTELPDEEVEKSQVNQ